MYQTLFPFFLLFFPIEGLILGSRELIFVDTFHLFFPIEGWIQYMRFVSVANTETQTCDRHRAFLLTLISLRYIRKPPWRFLFQGLPLFLCSHVVVKRLKS